jgi:hypothetical protein
MFPNVRLLIAAVVASVVALSCGFAMFATFRVNHEPLSRLATGTAPLQLAAGNPIPSAAPPASADSFGNRFPPNQGDVTGASTEAAPPQAEHDDSVEPPSTVASTAATAPDTNATEPEQPAPEQPAVAQAAEPRQDEAAVTPSELPSASEPPPAPSDTAAAEPPAEQAPPAVQAAPTEQANQETRPDTATTAAAEPPPAEVHHKPAHRHRVAAKPQQARQARAPVPIGRQPSGIGGPFVPLTGH